MTVHELGFNLATYNCNQNAKNANYLKTQFPVGLRKNNSAQML